MGEIPDKRYMNTALIAGATGLIGAQLLELLLNDDHYSLVKAISRKPLTIHHRKLQNIVVDFDTLPVDDRLKAHDIFCCLGTTIKQAGSQEAFIKVDFQYPSALARLAKNQGAKQYLLVSALGADKNSSIFYNRVKGETEDSIASVGFEATHIFRPALLLGSRKETRPGEDAAKFFFKIFGFLVPKKYKAVDSAKVANAMLWHAKQNKKGLFIHESADIQSF